jgi:hypothetical protein
VQVTFAPLRTGFPYLPRLGLRLTLGGAFDQFTWFGRGPGESYSDMKLSTSLGVWRGTVEQQHVPHVRPQASGNKADTRWAAVTDKKGVGLLAAAGGAGQVLNVGVARYTTEDLTAATHTYELPRRDLTEFNVDHLQAPIGSNSCGPEPQLRYRVPLFPTTFTVRLLPLDGSVTPVDAGARLNAT